MRALVLLLALAASATSAQSADPAPAPVDAPAPAAAEPAATASPEQPAPGAEATPPSAVDVPPPPAERMPALPAKPTKPAPAAPTRADSEQQRFEQFRRDLISLLALRAEPDLLVAAAALATPDAQDKARTPALKPPALIKRAQKFGPDDALVWWVSTFLECSIDPGHCPGEAAVKLQAVAPDNAAVWLPSLHAAKDPGKARALLATMAQTQRFDDYWSACVLALFHALQVLPVPAEVVGHGINQTAARVNLATSVGSAFSPNYARLGEMCRKNDAADEALVSDCLAVAHLLESSGSFRSQAVGLAIEDALLPAGTARDVLRVRQRAAAWQKQSFIELSARFPRDEALAQAYVDQLGKHDSEMSTVAEFLRSQHVHTDPPADWQPAQTDPTAPVRDPLAQPPVH